MKQAAAIPFRRKGDDIEVCLVTTANGGGWTFPKGVIDPGDSAKETALRETHEEAGLVGRLVGKSVGNYVYEKWGVTHRVKVFLMQVTREESQWKEKKTRERRWVSPGKAIKMLNGHPSNGLVDVAVKRVRSAGARKAA